MSRLDAISALALFAGSFLVLTTVRSLVRIPVHERVSPYVAPIASRLAVGPPAGRVGPAGGGPPPGTRSSALAAVLLPLALSLGDQLGRITGLRTDLAHRLRAAGRSTDAAAFRTRQFTGALVVLGCGAIVVITWGPSPLVALGLLLGAPTVAALVPEQQLEAEIARRRDLLEAELPLVAEQLAVLLASGMSLGTALERIAERGTGVAADEIGVVQVQVRRGTPQLEALQAWAERARSGSVDRLVGVLAMHTDAADIASLLATEARSMREAAHRTLVESIERRAQLVWIPVTVATLVPGLILIGVPFVSAMSRITG